MRRELAALWRLGGPAALAQVGMMSLGIVDTMMLGRLSILDMDAAALATVWIFGTSVIGMGLVFGADPFFSQAHGAKDRGRLAQALVRATLVAVFASAPLALAWFRGDLVLGALSDSATLVGPAAKYCAIQAVSAPAWLLFLVGRQFLQAREVVLPIVGVMLVANLFNAAANGVLIFGAGPIPSMGVEGAALATVLTRYVMLATVVAVLVRRYRNDEQLRRHLRSSSLATEVRNLGPTVRVGAPIALQLGLEMWAFQAVTVFAARLGEIPLAGHAIALQYASLSYMLPLGLSIGAATRVGNLLGEHKHDQAQKSANTAILAGAAIMLFTAIGFYAGAQFLPRAFTSDPAAIAVAASLLPIAAGFQLLDGLQVTAGAILRGMGTPWPAAVFNFIGYYLVGLPLAALLAFRFDFGTSGLWWGLSAGLFVVTLGLVPWVLLRGPKTAETIGPTPP